MFIKSWLSSLFDHAMDLNRNNILNLIPVQPSGKLLDLGCDEGTWTLRLADRMKTPHVFGVEIVETRAEEARKNY